MDENQLIQDFQSRIPEFKKIAEEKTHFATTDDPEEPDGPAFLYFGYVAGFIIDALGGRANRPLLKKIFEYFEDMATFGDDLPKWVLSAVVLERLSSDKKVLKKARSLMGPETLKASHVVEKKWGRE